MQAIYVVNGKLATLNDHDAANRSNKFYGAKMKEEMTDLVAWQVKQGIKISHPCYVIFTWLYSGRHDFDNIAFAKKYVLDGMVKAGILPNDNQSWVLGFTDNFEKVGKGEEGVVITVEEIES